MNLRTLALTLSDELVELVHALARLAAAQSRAFGAPWQRAPRPRRSLRAAAEHARKRVKS